MVDRLTPAMRATAFCVAFGFACMASIIFVSRSGGNRLPIVSRPAVKAIPARSARRHTVEKLTPTLPATRDACGSFVRAAIIFSSFSDVILPPRRNFPSEILKL
jgi:hypothetical protein